MGSGSVQNVRSVQKHDTSDNWTNVTSFVPLAGEIIVYSDLNKIKVGDGVKTVAELPYLSAGTDVDLSQYYTKAEINQKLSSVYRFVGSIATPMLIPSGSHQKGDVYNCRWGGRVPNSTMGATRNITNLTYTKVSDSCYTGTITFSQEISGDLMYAEEFGITISGYPDTQMFLVGSVTNAHAGSVEECYDLTFQVDPTKFSDYNNFSYSVYDNPILEFLTTISAASVSVPCDTYNILMNSNVSQYPDYYVSDGGNIAYTGSYTGEKLGWDPLGSTIDSSQFAKSSEVVKKDSTIEYISTGDNSFSGGLNRNSTIRKTQYVVSDITVSRNYAWNYCHIVGTGGRRQITFSDITKSYNFQNCTIDNVEIILGSGTLSYQGTGNPLQFKDCKFVNCKITGFATLYFKECDFVNTDISQQCRTTCAINMVDYNKMLNGSMTMDSKNAVCDVYRSSHSSAFLNLMGVLITHPDDTATFKSSNNRGNISMIGCVIPVGLTAASGASIMLQPATDYNFGI